MESGEKAKRLRIYISSTDRYVHTPLYEKIVFTAKQQGIAGATVLKGIMGYGLSSEVYTSSLWELTEKIPLIVEIIDKADNIDAFIEFIGPVLDEAGKGHIITVDDTIILMHKAGVKSR